MTEPKDILRRTAKMVSKKRSKTHGGYKYTFIRIAEMWGAYLGCELEPKDVAVMMVLLKTIRSQSGVFNMDDYNDMAGYAAIGGALAEHDESRMTRLEE